MKIKRAPVQIIQELKWALEAAKMKNASFGFPHEKIGDKTKDAFIKEETRLYRNTWIVPRIERALRWAEGGKP